MVLARPVYNSRGVSLAAADEALSEEKVKQIAEAEVSLIYVRDPRLADVVAAPLFPAELEARAIQSMRLLLGDTEDGNEAPLDRALKDARSSMNALVQCLFPTATGEPDVSGVDSFAEYDYVHPVRTATLALCIGHLCGFNRRSLTNLGLAAMLMNLGYRRLEPTALDKPGPSDASERDTIQKHVTLSSEMLQDSALNPEIIEAILQHHERWDGKGYPNGLKGGEISPLAQVLSVADIFQALVSKRPFREALQPHEAAEYFMANNGEMFDPELIQYFCRAVPHYPTGQMVKLNTGEAGVVIDPNVGHLGRPVVRIFPQPGQATRIYDLDLSRREHQAKLIVKAVA